VKKVTIDDVAKRVGVSKGTVSAVLNDKATVASETRDAVLKAMKELQYRPRGPAHYLKDDQTISNIGLIVREMDNPFYTAIALGVLEIANSKGYLALISSSEGNHKMEERLTRNLARKNIRGAIIAPVLEGSAEIHHLFGLKSINFPFVLLEKIKGIQANVVSIDNIKAMKMAVKYLFDHGHSKIVHFAGPNHASHTFERIDGFTRAFSESHHIFQTDMIVRTGAHYDQGYQKCLEYFQGRNPDSYPTAIVCYNDLVALGVMAALASMKIQVPEQISVIGNDNIPFSKNGPVALTTIQAPMMELGQRAAEILIRNIESPEPLPLESVVLDAELVIRDSTRCLTQPS